MYEDFTTVVFSVVLAPRAGLGLTAEVLVKKLGVDNGGLLR